MDTFCNNCGEPFFGGLCVWCTCDECGDNIRDGFCLNCNFHTCDQYSFNNSSNIPDFYTPPPPSFYCYNCGNPSEEGMSCGRCFCNQCGYANCICYAPSAETSYACDTSFDNYPQNDFNHPFQNFYEQVPYFNGDSSNFENCGGSFENSYNEPNFCYDSHGFNQPPQTSKFNNDVLELKSMMDKLKEMVINRYTSTSEPYERPMEIPRVEERKFQFCECCLYDDSSTITININPQNDSISSPVEPVDSLIMGDEPLDTIPATESDEFNKFSIENLVPIQSESGENSNGDSTFHPSFTPVEGSDVVSDEIEAFLVSDTIPTMVDDANFDPEEDIRVLEELLNEEPLTSLPPMNNDDYDEVESYSDSHNEYTTSDEDSCVDIDDIDEDVDTEIRDEALRETLLNVNLLISRIEALNDLPTFSPIPVMDSDFLPELEIFRFEETSSGNPTIHADISLPDYECFQFEIDSEPIFVNPLRDPLLEDVDIFLAADDSISPGIENDENDISFDLLSSRPPAKPPDEVFESGTNENIFRMVDEVSEIEFAFTIRVFHPFFVYPITSSLFHSTGSEDTIFDPGISIAKWPFSLLSPRTN